MSYTIVVASTEERIRYHGNIINISKRHCRIGKVTPKPPKHWDSLKHAKPTGYYPYTGIPRVKGLGVIDSLLYSF